MKRSCFLVTLMLLSTLLLHAQGLVMQSFEELPTDLTANTPGTIEKDQNGQKCALIKVESTLSDLTFDSGMLAVRKAEQHSGEWWVYVPEGVKRLSIFHPQLGVLRDKDLGQSVRQGRTYLLRLVAGEVQTVVKQSRTSQYVVFQVEPQSAVVFLNGEMLQTSDGTASKLMRFGQYDYRVQAPDYLPEVGRVTVSDPKHKHVVTVSLKPNFAQVTLSVAGNAEIWVNGQRKGSGQWTGKLGAGTYEIETRLPGHRSATTTRDIVAGTQPLTLQLDAPTPIYGEADINSTPAMADIYIDGKRVGQTPQLVSDLLVGSHQLRLSRQGYQDYSDTITIREGETESHSAALKQQAATSVASTPSPASTPEPSVAPLSTPETTDFIRNLLEHPMGNAKVDYRTSSFSQIKKALSDYTNIWASSEVRKHHVLWFNSYSSDLSAFSYRGVPFNMWSFRERGYYKYTWRLKEDYLGKEMQNVFLGLLADLRANGISCTTENNKSGRCVVDGGEYNVSFVVGKDGHESELSLEYRWY